MIWVLRVLFLAILAAMIGVTVWASNRVALWDTPRAVATHPWFIATLFDAYFGLLTFYCWVAYRETRIVARALWLVAILLLGNIAMAVYVLRVLLRMPADGRLERLLLREQ
jgi:predicted permease